MEAQWTVKRETLVLARMMRSRAIRECKPCGVKDGGVVRGMRAAVQRDRQMRRRISIQIP